MIDSRLRKAGEAFKIVLKDQSLFYQHPVVTIVLGILLPLQVFAGLAWLVWNHPGALLWDESILLSIHAGSRDWLDRSVFVLTGFGVYWGVLPAACLVCLWLTLQQRWRSLLFVLLSFGGCGLVNWAVKPLLHRGRPSLWELAHPALNFSFPSSHAMVSMTLVVSLAILAWGSRWFWLVLLPGSGFVVAIGWTRLYLGVHYPSDILAGWMIALAWTIGLSLAINPCAETPATSTQTQQGSAS